MSVVEVFKKNLNALFDQSKWSQRTFAEKAKITPAQANNYLNGENYPSLELLDRIAAAFGVEVSELLKSGDPPKPRISSLAEDVRIAIAEESKKAVQLAKEEFSGSEKKLKALPELPSLVQEFIELLPKMAESQQKTLLNTARKMHAERVAQGTQVKKNNNTS